MSSEIFHTDIIPKIFVIVTCTHKKKATQNEWPKSREETPTKGLKDIPTPRTSLTTIFKANQIKIKGKIIFILQRLSSNIKDTL